MTNKYKPVTIKYYYTELENSINERVNCCKENDLDYYIGDTISEEVSSMIPIYPVDIISIANTVRDVNLFEGPKDYGLLKENPTAYDIITAAFCELLISHAHEVFYNG